ncbi:hypothetical protein KGA66_13665 [Actinocrinis puniceicyclus]|uniref:Helicase n=1 Tax=Actinocrinis puniceicyclus TaxID=977794 RepID=A0A8J7WNP5_9ACTN|nr:SNF2-related protein [Actinocrinis puniceicyclus]MBS2964100.1 hypothetical protein [Actinocrinis puniceicyclus]
MAADPHGAVATLAAGYVSFHGLMVLGEAVQVLIARGVPVRLLLGVAPTATAQITLDGSADPEQLDRLLAEGHLALHAELDGIPVDKATRAKLSRLRAWLSDPLVTTRRYEAEFFHSKAVVIEPVDRPVEAVVGSFNLTRAGLRSNVELGVSAGREQAAGTARWVRDWWKAAAPYDLAGMISERFAYLPPELVYLRMLAERFCGEIDAGDSRLGLTWFQSLGVAKAAAVIERRGGVLVADEVGLGKTYIAGELIDRAQRAGEGPVLVLCPAHLKRNVWRAKTNEWGLKVELLSYHQLLWRGMKTLRSGAAFPTYAMVVCDEAHFLRNRRNLTRKCFDKLMGDQEHRPRTVLLSGTPVNNKGADLAELMHLAAPAPIEDRVYTPGWAPWPGRRLSQRQIRERCSKALTLQQRELRELHEEINDLVVRRTRQYVRDACHEGIERPAFPVVNSKPVIYELADAGTNLYSAVLDAAATSKALSDPRFAEAMRALRGPQALSAPLALAAYAPGQYALDPLQVPWWVEVLLCLLRCTLLKRLESSPAALADTARNMARRTKSALVDLDRGRVRISVSMKEMRLLRDLVRTWIDGAGDELDGQIGRDELDARLSDFLGGQARCGPQGGIPKARFQLATQYDVPALRQALQRDAEALERIVALAEQACRDDPKAAAFLNLFDELGGKVVVFASSRITSADLTARIEAHIAARGTVHRYAGRIASVGRTEPVSKKELATVLGHFCPDTAAGVPTRLGQTKPKDLYDVLITTDILSEGVNLQQANVIVNYDLPWNPTRLEQRLGRLDRIGSPHAVIDCHTFLPDRALDAWLCLMDKLLEKTAVAAKLIGVTAALLPDATVNIMNFTTLIGWIYTPRTEKASRPLPMIEMQRMWLQRARMIPALAARLEHLTPWACAVHPQPADEPLVVYCFSVVGTEAGPTITLFCRVYGGARRGATLLDTVRCLEAIHIEPGDWIDAHAAGTAPADTPRPISAADQQLVDDLLEVARDTVAGTYHVPDHEACERIKLVAWIMRPGRDA